MSINEIPINQGVFKTQHNRSLRNSPFAENLVNLFIDNAGGNFDRPTLSLLTTLSSVTPIGMRYFSDVLFVVTSDRKCYTVDANSTIVDVTGVTLPGIKRPTFADGGSTLYVAGGDEPIKWAGVGNTTALLGGSPPKMTHIVFLDGYLIGNRRLDSENNKVIQFSDNDTPETWNALNIFSAVADPDEVQALAVNQRILAVVGENTTELWQNVGTVPVPFNRSFVYQYGTPAPYSVWVEDNSLFFIDQDRRILRSVGQQPTRISDGIEDALAGYSTVTDCWTSSFSYKGSIHVIFNFPDAGAAWSIDLKNNQWTEWNGYDNGLARPRINAMTYVPSLKTTYAGDFDTGKVWTFSDTVKTDAGGIFQRKRTFSHRDAGTSVRKRANWLKVNLDRNVASSFSGTTSQTNPTLELRWKDDNKNWSTWRRKQLGQIGESRYYVRFNRLGIYRTRQYELRMSDPSELNIVSVEANEDLLTS